MKKILVISSSVRQGRISHRIALYLAARAAEREGTEVSIADLKEYNFPLFDERLFNMNDPQPELADYARRVEQADGVIVVSPVYNTSFPASLKNAVDVLYSEWNKKPVMVASVSYGATAPIATCQHLQNLFMFLGARVASPLYTVTNAGTDFTEEGEPIDSQRAARFSDPALDEFFRFVEWSAE